MKTPLLPPLKLALKSRSIQSLMEPLKPDQVCNVQLPHYRHDRDLALLISIQPSANDWISQIMKRTTVLLCIVDDLLLFCSRETQCPIPMIRHLHTVLSSKCRRHIVSIPRVCNLQCRPHLIYLEFRHNLLCMCHKPLLGLRFSLVAPHEPSCSLLLAHPIHQNPHLLYNPARGK
jgi:hypothetical protein